SEAATSKGSPDGGSARLLHSQRGFARNTGALRGHGNAAPNSGLRSPSDAVATDPDDHDDDGYAEHDEYPRRNGLSLPVIRRLAVNKPENANQRQHLDQLTKPAALVGIIGTLAARPPPRPTDPRDQYNFLSDGDAGAGGRLRTEWHGANPVRGG